MSLWIDVTSSWSWKGPAVGIIRCEVEVARRLSVRQENIRFCRFTRRAGPIVEVSHSELTERLEYRGSGWPDTLRTTSRRFAARGYRKIHRIFGHGAQEVFTHPFRAGDTYLSLGMDAWDKDLQQLDDVKRTVGLRVVMTCHDLIPIRSPQWVNAAEREFIPGHTRRTIQLADVVLCNSDDTMMDFARYAAEEQLTCPSLTRIRLGAERLGAPETTGTAPDGVTRPFILYVSSLARRKNHETLYRAYHRMLRRSTASLPQMIWAGKADPDATVLLQDIQLDPVIGDRIRHLGDASDDQLHWLYRNCEFTVFASLAEGWGLPVGESTAYGKLCLASDLPAVREVAADLHTYVDPWSVERWEHALTSIVGSPEYLEARTQAVVDANWSRTWEQTVDDVLRACDH
jgi:glycosyltransferase involved in cell wall biosynthesis